jgi:hypothetical protein
VLVTFVFLLGVIKAWFLFIIAVPLQVIVLFWMSLLYKGKLGKKTLSAPKKK